MDILKEKQYKDYATLSRYATIPFYYNTLDNKYEYATTKHLDNTTAYRIHIVQPRETYDTISLKYYSNPTYFWIICDFNRIIDPFEHPKVGTILKIPTLSKLEFE